MKYSNSHLSLFTGSGALDIAAEWAGFETVMMVEKDQFCQEQLKNMFPGVPIHGNIRSFNREKFKEYTGRERVALVTGGFPCQPTSQMGKRKGAQDHRWEWPAMLRVIRELRPDNVLAENPCGILDQEKGILFESICTDLEAIGYDVWAFNIPACGTGAAQVRKRVFIMAGLGSVGLHGGRYKKYVDTKEISNGRKETQRQRPGVGIESAILCMANEAPDILCEATKSVKQRAEWIKALGNAVDPFQVYPLLSWLMEMRKAGLSLGACGKVPVGVEKDLSWHN
jgi:DNA (cytosine-5)-methyltransferase 1